MKLIPENATPPVEEKKVLPTNGNGNGVPNPGGEKLPPKNNAVPKGLVTEEYLIQQIKKVAEEQKGVKQIPRGNELELDLLKEIDEKKEKGTDKKTTQQQTQQQPQGKHVKRCKCSQCPPIKDMRGGHKKGCNCEMCLDKRGGVWMFVDKQNKLYEWKPEPETVKTETVPGTGGRQAQDEQQPGADQRPPPRDTSIKFLNVLLRAVSKMMKLREEDVLITPVQEEEIIELRPEQVVVKRTNLAYYGMMITTIFANIFTARKRV